MPRKGVNKKRKVSATGPEEGEAMENPIADLEPHDAEVHTDATSAAERTSQSQGDPCLVADFVERQLLSLATGYPSDISITMKGGEIIKCHTYFLMQTSPTLARLAQMKVPQLPSVLPQHFRCVLQVLYIGKTKEPQDVETLLAMGHFAIEFDVPAVVSFCKKHLAMLLDAENVFGLLKFGCTIKDREMVRSCLHVIRLNAGTVLKTKYFQEHCTESQLKIIVKQEKLLGITEVELFEACLTWSNAKAVEARRAALSDTILRYVRFRLFSAEEFAMHVCPTGLLADDVWKDVLRSCATGDPKFIPKGFSTSNTSRNYDVVHGELN